MSFQNTVKRIMADRSNEPGWRKPHLRLHYNPRPQWALGNWGDWYPWSVQMVRDMRPSYGRPNVTTNQHWDAAGALRAARVFWWPSL